MSSYRHKSKIVRHLEAPSLIDQCLNVICEHLELFIEQDSQTLVHRFKDSNYAFHISRLAEAFMAKLEDQKKLDNALLKLFDPQKTTLHLLRLRNTRCICIDALNVCAGHRIKYLDCQYVKCMTVDDILSCLSKWSMTNIQTANFTGCLFYMDRCGFTFLNLLPTLCNVRNLNVSFSDFTQHNLQAVCENMPFLQQLDISGTCVISLQPLQCIASNITHLALGDLPDCSDATEILAQMRLLRSLDLSLWHEQAPLIDIANDLDIRPLASRVCHMPFTLELTWPHLQHFDVSGWRDSLCYRKVMQFIRRHASLSLRSVGIVLTVVPDSEWWDAPLPSTIEVAGCATPAQIVCALQRYTKRALYVQKTLFHLFRLSTDDTDAAQLNIAEPSQSLDVQQFADTILPLIVNAMEVHCTRFGVQMGATACIYNMSRGDRASRLRPLHLAAAVDATMLAMRTYPADYQLQKNALLTLCSDHVLHELHPMDRFDALQLALESLCHFHDDASLTRMAVAICSILASKVGTQHTTKLGQQPLYVSRLLELVRTHLEQQQSSFGDITLKFTLRAFWNLTDENETMCTQFLRQEGGPLFVAVLNAFECDAGVQTKCLGLLNNIAEVPALRAELLSTAHRPKRLRRRTPYQVVTEPKPVLLIDTLAVLLNKGNINISYFAAGVIANLAADGQEWNFENLQPRFTRSEILFFLKRQVLSWKQPENEMVAYRSFKPLLALLVSSQWPPKTKNEASGTDEQICDHLANTYLCQPPKEVQLWAIWAIYHMCTKNPKRYYVMLAKEGGYIIFDYLLSTDYRECTTDSNVKAISFNTDYLMISTVRQLCQKLVQGLQRYCHEDNRLMKT